MLKAFGGVLLVTLSVFLGHDQKTKKLRACETIRLLIALFDELAYAIEHSSAGVAQTLTECSRLEQYSGLAFLKTSLEALNTGNALHRAITQAFSQDARCEMLSRDEKQICLSVFQDLSTLARQTQLERLRTASSKLQAALGCRQEDPRMRGNYYELMAFLTGSCVVLLLI